MSPIGITWRRTVGMARRLYSTAFVVCGFLSATAALFSFRLGEADGGFLQLMPLMSASISPVLPVLAALLAMDAWSEERRTGRIDMMLSIAVRERDFVIGKFFGVWTVLLMSIGLFMVSAIVLLAFFAPSAIAGIRVLDALPAFLVLAMQGALWCAVSLAMSAMVSNAAIAACASMAILVVVPRALWFGVVAFYCDMRKSLGDFPFDAHAVDIASGAVSTSVVAFYVTLVLIMLFINSKMVMYNRLVGRAALSIKLSTWFAIALALVFAVMTIRLSAKLNITIDFPIGDNWHSSFSSRTRSILSESEGDIVVTCFMPRDGKEFKSIGRFLRQLKRLSESVGGAKFTIRYVDPRWDVGDAEKLVRQGIAENCVIFENGRKMMTLNLSDGIGERACASAIRKLFARPLRQNVYWTIGHGECRFDEYGQFGMSDIARELVREGYRNLTLDLTSCEQIPSDCALVVIAGAKDDFSRIEFGRLNAYLQDGGRALVMLNSAEHGGIVSALPSWGMKPVVRSLVGSKTLHGSDIIVSNFANHPISCPLANSRIVLEKPIVFLPSVAATTDVGTGRIEFSPIAEVDGAALVVVVERGVGAGNDLAIRPTRIVAIGASEFVMNGQLSAKANANRDFFLNCVAYLSGADALGEDGADANVLVVGLDRTGKISHFVVTVVILPTALLALLSVMTYFRRRST